MPSVSVEAEPYGVRVSALCPGVVRTPILEGGKFGRLVQEIPRDAALKQWEVLRPMDPGRFAARTLDAVRRNPPLIVIPGWWRLVAWLLRVVPALEMPLARRGYRDVLRELGATPPRAHA